MAKIITCMSFRGRGVAAGEGYFKFKSPLTRRIRGDLSHKGRGGILILSFSLLFYFSCSHAQTKDRYPFPTVNQQQQFQRLITQLRCLVCQNQDLADSNADLAKDLKRQVYEMVLANKTDAEIKQYLTARYGNFVLFKPPFNPQTIVLWLLPFILLAGGFFLLWRLTRKSL